VDRKTWTPLRATAAQGRVTAEIGEALLAPTNRLYLRVEM